MVKYKKGFMKTLEVVIAIMITFLFVLFIIPQSEFSGKKDKKIMVFEDLQNDPDFRTCVLARDQLCVYQFIDGVLPNTYDFKVLITSKPEETLDNLPKKELYVDSFFFAHVDQPIIVKVYYWIE